MAKIKIADTGDPSLDGEYPLDMGYITNRELHIVKDVAGVRAGEISDALGGGDNDVVVAFTVIAMRRAGKTVDVDRLWELPAGKITADFDDEEVSQDDPPAERPSGASVVRPISSGAGSRDDSASLDSDPSSTGGQRSEPTAESA